MRKMVLREAATRAQRTNDLVRCLIDWWRKNRRDFPWRNTRDPYAILIAEVLLRKTTANQVAKIFDGFLSKYRRPEDLLKTSTREIEKDLKPLGIYKVRSRLLKRAAELLVQKHHGKVPRPEKELLELPGIKKYSANAVRCFAYEESAPIVDRNVARVLQRVFGVMPQKKPIYADDPRLWDLASRLVPPKGAREFNWALLDFAAKICTAKRPLCSICPLAYFCKTYQKSNK